MLFMKQSAWKEHLLLFLPASSFIWLLAVLCFTLACLLSFLFAEHCFQHESMFGEHVDMFAKQIPSFACNMDACPSDLNPSVLLIIKDICCRDGGVDLFWDLVLTPQSWSPQDSWSKHVFFFVPVRVSQLHNTRMGPQKSAWCSLSISNQGLFWCFVVRFWQNRCRWKFCLEELLDNSQRHLCDTDKFLRLLREWKSRESARTNVMVNLGWSDLVSSVEISFCQVFFMPTWCSANWLMQIVFRLGSTDPCH